MLGREPDGVVLHVGGDDVRQAGAAVLTALAVLRGAAALPEVLHGRVQHQVVGLREKNRLL